MEESHAAPGGMNDLVAGGESKAQEVRHESALLVEAELQEELYHGPCAWRRNRRTQELLRTNYFHRFPILLYAGNQTDEMQDPLA